MTHLRHARDWKRQTEASANFGEDRPYSALMPTGLITFAYFSVSSAMRLPKSAGEPAAGMDPSHEREPARRPFLRTGAPSKSDFVKIIEEFRALGGVLINRPWDMPSSSAGLHKTSLAPVVVRWTRPTVLLSEVSANGSRHRQLARASRHRAAPRGLAHGHLQRTGGRREPLQERLRPDRRAAQTPLRADPEPGRSRQGLHGPREGNAQRSHQGPQQRDGGRAESCRQPQRPGGHEAA